ncbi:MAG: ABA4-like family protein [Bacteroidia bacterium]
MTILFQIANFVALIGWVLMLLIPQRRHTLAMIRYGVVLLLALTYVVLIAPLLLDFRPDTFSTLENVMLLFADPRTLTAAWVHFLAFDLFVGAHIVEQGILIGLKRWQYSLCLPFTFMFGPLGLLMFYGFKLSRG